LPLEVKFQHLHAGKKNTKTISLYIVIYRTCAEMDWARDNVGLSVTDLENVFKYEDKSTVVVRMLGGIDKVCIRLHYHPRKLIHSRGR
jgi:hypothetical protein